jgi:hypothetical protein
VRLHGLKHVFFSPAAGPIQLSHMVVFVSFIYNKANFKFANRSAFKNEIKIKIKFEGLVVVHRVRYKFSSVHTGVYC